MFHLIQHIADRCHAVAVRRGKGTGYLDCERDLNAELAEYWQAVETNNLTSYGHVEDCARIREDGAFTTYYDEHIHNTDKDELADMLIIAATWTATVKENNPAMVSKPLRTIDEVFIIGAVSFVIGQINYRKDAELLRDVVCQKLRYNELRKD